MSRTAGYMPGPRSLTACCCMYSGLRAGAPGLDFETWGSPVLKSPPTTYIRHHAVRDREAISDWL